MEAPGGACSPASPRAASTLFSRTGGATKALKPQKKWISAWPTRRPPFPSQRATRKDGKTAKEAKQSKRFRKAQASVPGRMNPS